MCCSDQTFIAKKLVTHVISQFKKLRDPRDSSDFTIIFGTKKISVHKNVLAAQTSFFAPLTFLKTTNK